MQGLHSLSRYLKTTWMLRCCSVCNQLCYHPAAAQRAPGKEHTTTPAPTSLKYCWAMNSTSSICLSPLLLISFCWLFSSSVCFCWCSDTCVEFLGQLHRRVSPHVPNYRLCCMWYTLVAYAYCIYIYIYIRKKEKVLGSHKTEWASVTYRVPASGF